MDKPQAGRRVPLTIGQKASRTMTVTSAHVKAYAEMTGDYNPLHFDAAFAARTKFGKLVAQGGLTTGILHALVAMDMPGPGTVFLSQNWKFTAPVFIGDTITAITEVVDKRESKSRPEWGIVTFVHKGVNQRGEVVAICRRQAMMLKKRAA